jgi:type I restriction enzyme M protein
LTLTNFPGTLARVKIMPDLRANEREFASKVYQWMDSAFSRGGHPFESVSGETGIKIGGKTLFLDGAIWLNRAANLAFSNFELKTPETDVRDSELLKNAAEKARVLHADYFVTWNMRDTVVWRVPHEGELFTNSLVAYDKFPPLTQITGVEDIKNKQKEIILRERARDILDLLARAKRDGHFHQIDLDTTFFVGKLREATNTVAPLFAQSLAGLRSHDRNFNNEIEAWRVKQGIKSGAPNENEVIARQAVYRLLAKIIFYQAMRRSHSLPAMDFVGVSPNKFQRKLSEFLAQARAIDYQAVFIEDITDRIPIPDFAAKQLEKLVADLQRYNFSQMPEDVIGTVFQELIPTEERHTLGQYFTSTDLADLVLGFCVRSPKDTVIDPTCGTGTFLVRAYDMKRTTGERNHLHLLSQIWGVDIAAFPAELATINLFSRDISEYANFPRVVHKDFFEVKPGDKFDFPPPKPNIDPNLKITETIPSFDAAVGNFPFIRQELIEQKAKGYKGTLDQALERDWRGKYSELFKNGETKLSGQADIYAYLFFHTAAFLKSDGRLGFITSNSWLDVAYGYELQKFFLRKFKLVAILESRCEPWFEDSSINTVVTILELCENARERSVNVAKFVKVKRRLADLMIRDLKLYPVERWQQIAKLVNRIESAHTHHHTHELVKDLRVFEDEDIRIRMKSQADLLDEVEGAGKTVKWGQFIRAPDSYFTVLEKCKKQKTSLVKLEDVAPVQRGITTNDVEFFFLNKEKLNHWQIEKKFLLDPVVYTPKEVPNIVIDRKKLKQTLFKCDLPRKHLAGMNALRYIQNHERGKRNLTGDWYLLRDIIQKAGCVLHARHGDTFRVLLNDKGFALNDNLYHITPEKASLVRLLCAVLNSAWFALNIELSGRLNLGDGALKLQVFEASDIVIPDPRKFSAEEKRKILSAFDKLTKRDILPYADEIKQKDRRELDRAVFCAMKLENSDADACEKGAFELIAERHLIAEMRSKQAKARVERDTGKILSEVIGEILPDGARNFPDAFWPQGFNERKPNAFKEVNVTGKRLRLGHAMLMQQEVVDQDGQVIMCSSRAEAEFLIYVAKPDNYIVRLPTDKFVIEKTVASYLRYLDDLEKQFLRKFAERTLNHAEAETLTRRALETISPFSTDD